MTDKGRSVFARKNIRRGEFICKYDGKLCSCGVLCKNQKEYEKLGAGSYILEFKFKEKQWAIDATLEDGSIGRLINHSKKFKNVKPVVGQEQGVPFIYFLALTNIVKMMRYCMIMVTIL